MPKRKAAVQLSPNEERKDYNVILVNEVLATLKLKPLSEDEIYDLTNKLNESIFELVDIRTFLIRHLIPYRVNKIIPDLLDEAQGKIGHGIPDSPERAARQEARRAEREGSLATTAAYDSDSDSDAESESSVSTIVPSFNNLRIKYNEETQEYELIDDTRDAASVVGSLVSEAVPGNNIETLKVIVSNLILKELEIPSSPTPMDFTEASSTPEAEAEAASMVVSEASSVAESIMDVLPYLQFNKDPNLTFKQVKEKMDTIMLELSNREDPMVVKISSTPLPTSIPEHYIYCTKIFTTKGRPTSAKYAVEQARISSIPNLRITNPNLYQLLSADKQKRSDMMCGPRAVLACLGSKLTGYQTGMGLSMAHLTIAFMRQLKIDPIDPNQKACTLVFSTSTEAVFTPNDETISALKKLFFTQLRPIITQLSPKKITAFLFMGYSRTSGGGHFIRIILFPSSEYYQEYFVPELSYSVMFVDPAKPEMSQTLDQFIKKPQNEDLTTISTFEWPTTFEIQSCGLTYSRINNVIISTTADPTRRGGSLAKKGTMKKDKNTTGSGIRSKNKRNKTARHLKKRVKHLLKAAKKRGKSGKRSKLKKNATRKSRTKKDNTIKRLKIKGLGRTRKLNKHGRK
jgi:hypothetical protein